MYPISMEYNTKTGETTFVYHEIPDKIVADFFLGAYERDLIKQREEHIDDLILSTTGKKV